MTYRQSGPVREAILTSAGRPEMTVVMARLKSGASMCAGFWRPRTTRRSASTRRWPADPAHAVKRVDGKGVCVGTLATP